MHSTNEGIHRHSWLRRLPIYGDTRPDSSWHQNKYILIVTSPLHSTNTAHIRRLPIYGDTQQILPIYGGCMCLSVWYQNQYIQQMNALTDSSWHHQYFQQILPIYGDYPYMEIPDLTHRVIRTNTFNKWRLSLNALNIWRYWHHQQIVTSPILTSPIHSTNTAHIWRLPIWNSIYRHSWLSCFPCPYMEITHPTNLSQSDIMNRLM